MFSVASLISSSILPAKERGNSNGHMYIALRCQLHFYHPFAIMLFSNALNICLKWPVTAFRGGLHWIIGARCLRLSFIWIISPLPLQLLGVRNRYSLSSTVT